MTIYHYCENFDSVKTDYKEFGCRYCKQKIKNTECCIHFIIIKDINKPLQHYFKSICIENIENLNKIKIIKVITE